MTEWILMHGFGCSLSSLYNYVWMLVGLFLVSSMSMRVPKIFGNNPVSVLATIFLISYAKILCTI